MAFIYKILIGGDSGVGKTTFILRLKTGIFNDKMKMTIGVDFYQQVVKLDGNDHSLQIWDLGGQERFQTMIDAYAKGASAAIVMYDLTRKDTLNHVEDWMKNIRNGAKSPDLPILLIGTKADLFEEAALSTFYEDPYFKSLNIIGHHLISSKSGFGVTDVLPKIVKFILQKGVKKSKYGFTK